MKFIYPEFLYALFAIAIPIIIHLFNFRKFKKVYFSNVSLLKEVKQETQSTANLKKLLVLLSRILAIVFLVLAFAQPFIPINKNSGKRAHHLIGIYVDNSFSMESTGEKGNLLDEAKTKAIEIVKSYPSTDKFVLMSNTFSAGDQRLLTNEEIIDKIEDINIATNTKMLSAIYSRNREILNSSEKVNRLFYVISDFQKTITDFNAISSDSLINTYLVPIHSNQSNNLYIDSCWFENPNHVLHQQEKLYVRVKNDSKNDLENIPIKLFINKKMAAPANINISANDETIVVLNYRNQSNGIQQGKVELKDSPVTADNSFYFSYTISKNINVLCINDKATSSSLKAVYTTDSIFNFSEFNINQLDYSLIKRSHLVILNQLDEVNSGLSNTLTPFIENGGSLLIFPSDNINYENYRELMSALQINYYTAADTHNTKVNEINYRHPIYKNVFESKPKQRLNLPLVNTHYLFSSNKTAFKTKVLTLKNGHSFLNEYSTNKGTIYVFSTGLNEQFSNLSNHALFVPTLYNIALLSQSNYPLFHIIGSNSTIKLNQVEKNSVYHIKNENVDVIPKVYHKANSTTIFVNSAIENAGNYLLQTNATTIGLAYNYNRSESQLACYSLEELAEKINRTSLNTHLITTKKGSIKASLNELKLGKKYWKTCLVLTLIFLGIEIILIKLT